MAEVIAAYSDCLDVKVSHDETRLIEYSNENDFANISYSITPRPTFGIRVHSKFFKERTPEENESEDQSDSDVVKLSGSVKAQRQLQIEPVPYFFHYLLKLILQHNYIFIDEEEWTKEESYEQKILNEFFPMEGAEVWLTQKSEGYYSNTYGTV
jgi:hypothetical protein